MKENGSLIYNVNRIINVSTWMTTLSYVFLVLGLFQVIGRIIIYVSDFSMWSSDIRNLFEYTTMSLEPMFRGLIWVLFFLGTRWLSEVVYVLIDIEHNTRNVDDIEDN